MVGTLLAMNTGVVGAEEPLGGSQSYVVTFDAGADTDAVLMDLELSVDLVITRRFDHAVKGAVVTTGAVPEEMAMVPGVATVDRDLEVGLPPGEQDPNAPVVDPDAPGADPVTPPAEPDDPTEPPDEGTDPADDPAPWGLDRIDQRALPLSGTFDPVTDGKGVTVYVVDSGITPHEEFGDRLAPGVDLVNDGGGTLDCEGHGTHVAGTIAGATVGVAKAATIVPVRSFDCTGRSSTGTTIAAFDWVVAHHTPGSPAVVNFSAGGGATEAEEAAIARMLASGITVVTAGGNDNESACGHASGVGVKGAIVVGSTDADDRRSYFSDIGPCLDLFAPGGDIVSASNLSPDSFTLKSGTSMATPHVAGAAAVLLALDPWRTPADVESALLTDATAGAVVEPGADSPNLLLYSDPDRAATAAPPPAPVAPTTAPPQVAAAVEDAPRSVASTAALAFTGGDARSMFLLGFTMLLLGAAAVMTARRQERAAAMASAAAAAAVSRPAPALQLVAKRRR
jgi:subtilisin family serine protease